MTRAVIKLKRDITSALPIIDRVIDSCAYNSEVPVAAFRYKNFSVILHKRDIVINNAGDEGSAMEVINFLKDIVNNADRINGKVRTY